MKTAPVLVILRGNSASGKSTVARRVQRQLPRGRVAVIGQDQVRRELLWEHGSGKGDILGVPGEVVLTERQSEDEIVGLVLSDVANLS